MSRSSSAQTAAGYNDSVRYPSIASKIQKGLARLRDDNICTDFEVIVHGQSFHCHKAVLASGSDYFKAMFTSGMKETVQNQATLENISSEAFQTVLDLIYPKDDDINPLNNRTEDELSELLRIADMLQIECLSSLLLELLEDTMADHNCVGRWQTGNNLLSDKLSTMARTYLLANFDNVSKSSDMLSLDYEEFLSIISDNTLQVTNEISVWKSISKWVHFSRLNREENMQELLENCCLTEIDRSALSETIAFDETVRLNSCASMLVQEAVKFKNHPGDHGNVELKLRPCMGKEQVRILLGLANGEGDLVMVILRSNAKKSILKKCPFSTFKEFACCVHGRSIYVSGGNGNDDTMFEYVEQKSGWITCPGKLPIPLVSHVMVATDDSLYVLGGRSSEGINKRVLQYKLRSKNWYLHGDIIVPVESASAVCINKKIYVFGGVSGEDAFLATSIVQMYDTSTKTATLLQSQLPSPCAFSGAIKRKGVVYIATCNGKVVRFSGKHLETSELIATIPGFNGRKQFAVSMKKNIFIVYGGSTLHENGHQEISKTKLDICVKSGKILEHIPSTSSWIFCGGALLVVLSLDHVGKSSPQSTATT